MQQMVGWVRENYNKLVALAKKGSPSCSGSRTSAPSSVGEEVSSRFWDSSWRPAWFSCSTGWVSACCRWLRGPVVDSASLTAGTLFYRRLTQLLAQLELERTPFETQGEFAVRAAKFLTGQGHSTQSVADVPGEVVNAFYRVRFGHLELEPGSLEELDARLDALEASMKHD